jgi:sortase B
MVGWIRMDGTSLDYPVMHTPDDPEKYLHVDFDQKNSYPGTPFLDAACTMDSTNLLIYGHNMPNGTMFRSLFKYEQSHYWREHPTIVFDTLYEQQEYEVLSAFYDRVYYKTETVFKFYQFIDPETEEEFNAGIEQLKKKSLYDTGVTAQYGDKLITLVTCSYHTDNGRFVVVARRKA